MEIPIHLAYLGLVGCFGIIWSILFISLPQTRSIQIQISILAAPLGPVIEWLYFQDYWYPMSVWESNVGPFRVLVEDFAFAFFFAGVTSMVAHLTGKKVDDFRLKNPIHLIVIGCASMFLSLPFFKMGLNSIIATSIGFLLITMGISMTKKDSLKYAFRCGFITAMIMFSIYFASWQTVSNIEEIMKSTWLLYDHSVLGIRFMDVPITELVWGFSWGSMRGAVRNLLFG